MSLTLNQAAKKDKTNQLLLCWFLNNHSKIHSQSPPEWPAAIKHCRQTTKTVEKLFVTTIASSMTHLDHETHAFEMPGFTFRCSLLKYTNFTAFNNQLRLYVCGLEESKHNLNQSTDKHFSGGSPSETSILITHSLLYGSGLYSMLSSMSLPANTATVPMMHTAMNTQSRMWSKTIATNFHSSAAWNEMGRVARKSCLRTSDFGLT